MSAWSRMGSRQSVRAMREAIALAFVLGAALHYIVEVDNAPPPVRDMPGSRVAPIVSLDAPGDWVTRFVGLNKVQVGGSFD